jgi:hypothetical protein
MTEFESGLAELKPQASALDRDALFFRAGQAAALRELDVRRRAWARWSWPVAFSGMTAIAATLLAMLLVRSTPNIVPSVATARPTDAATEELKPQAAPLVLADQKPQLESVAAYSRLRDDVLRRGIDAGMPPMTVPATSLTVAGEPLAYHAMLHRMLQDM